eukprot:11306122-Alexandrium_andersonii.AAC.1
MCIRDRVHPASNDRRRLAQRHAVGLRSREWPREVAPLGGPDGFPAGAAVAPRGGVPQDGQARHPDGAASLRQ